MALHQYYAGSKKRPPQYPRPSDAANRRRTRLTPNEMAKRLLAQRRRRRR